MGLEPASRALGQPGVATCPGRARGLGAGGAGARAPHAAQSPPHVCRGAALGVFLVVWRLVAGAEGLWAAWLEAAVSSLSHGFARSDAGVSSPGRPTLKSYHRALSLINLFFLKKKKVVTTAALEGEAKAKLHLIVPRTVFLASTSSGSVLAQKGACGSARGPGWAGPGRAEPSRAEPSLPAWLPAAGCQAAPRPEGVAGRGALCPQRLWLCDPHCLPDRSPALILNLARRWLGSLLLFKLDCSGCAVRPNCAAPHIKYGLCQASLH